MARGGRNDSWVGSSLPEFDIFCKQPCKRSGAPLEVTCPPPRLGLGPLGPSWGGQPSPRSPSLPAASRPRAGTQLGQKRGPSCKS